MEGYKSIFKLISKITDIFKGTEKLCNMNIITEYDIYTISYGMVKNFSFSTKDTEYISLDTLLSVLESEFNNILRIDMCYKAPMFNLKNKWD